MHHIDLGSGTPVVLCIHGFAQSSAFWLPTAERLADAGARAIAVDLPGFGRSAREPGPYNMAGFADALAALLDKLALPKVVVAGGSMGSVVAQHFALQHPQRLERLLLVATGSYNPDPDAALRRADTIAAEGWGEAQSRAQVAGFFHEPLPAEQMATLEHEAWLAAPAALADATRSNATMRTLERLHEITVPTLILQGRHDGGRTVAHGEEMRDRLPQATLAVLEHAGHTPQLEEPDAFYALALPFLLQGTLP